MHLVKYVIQIVVIKIVIVSLEFVIGRAPTIIVGWLARPWYGYATIV